MSLSLKFWAQPFFTTDNKQDEGVHPGGDGGGADKQMFQVTNISSNKKKLKGVQVNKGKGWGQLKVQNWTWIKELLRKKR